MRSEAADERARIHRFPVDADAARPRAQPRRPHSGTTDFWRQRLTAVAMTLLIVPVLVIVLMLLGRNQAGAAQILGSLPIAVILLLFIVASTWHMKIGMQVVIEDYVHNEKLKLASIMEIGRAHV